MILNIVIPTRWRAAKLSNCLNSIFHSLEYVDKKHTVEIYIYFSEVDEFEENKTFFKEVPFVHILFVERYRVPDFWNTFLKNMEADAMMCANDDIQFFDNTISSVLEVFPENFPDMDGVLGLSQSNLPVGDALEGAFSVIGKKFADRFPDKQVYCPDYDRFMGDYELMIFAQSINKFVFNKDIKIVHYHPAYNEKLLDNTHKDVRTHLRKDRKTLEIRKSRELLWGKNFELINQSIEE